MNSAVDIEKSLKELRRMEIAILMLKRDIALSSPRILKGVFGYCDKTVSTLCSITHNELLQLNEAQNNLPILTLRSKNDGLKRLLKSLPSPLLSDLELDRVTAA